MNFLFIFFTVCIIFIFGVGIFFIVESLENSNTIPHDTELSQILKMFDVLYEKEGRPRMTERVCLGYELNITLKWKTALVKIEYNAIRKRYYSDISIYDDGQLIDRISAITNSYSFQKCIEDLTSKFPEISDRCREFQVRYNKEQYQEEERRQKALNKYV